VSVDAWRLPWQGKMVPHAVIEILRECNITCRACYKNCPPEPPKTLVQIEEELDALLELRRLSSVSLLGGEVSLHPQLCDIIRLIKGKGLCVELMTNGVTMDADFCRSLKDAGLDVIYFHIERGQTRPDLPDTHTGEDLNNLRREKAVTAGRAGLDVGLTATAYPGEIRDIHDVMSLTLDTPELNYLLITLFRDHAGIQSLRGDIRTGFAGSGTPPDASSLQNNTWFAEWVRNEFELEPFGWMGSNMDRDDPRWLSYLIGAVYDGDAAPHIEYIRPSLLEKVSMLIFRIAGRYPMYLEQNQARFRTQLALNGILGGRRRSNRELVRRSGKSGVQLTTKRILFQNPAELTADGQLIHCEWCPDAVLKNGALVPVCVADNVS